MRDRDRAAVRDMRTFVAEALALAGDRLPDPEGDRVAYLALCRLIELVGEAATRISPELRAAHPEIPWTRIIAMRNRLIHAYDDIEDVVLASTVRLELPRLQRGLANIEKRRSD
jgi:uncharacterized protein with HEPN domain